MTTLEVVEAVQRSLENEGFLQSIRAQLRANVLRIISSGPDYVPSQGKVVEFSKRRSGALSMFLVKDLLSHLGMKETLAIFEAESGVNGPTDIDHTVLETELQIRRIQDLCLIECLVQKSSASGRSSRTFYHSTSGTESQRDESSKANTSLSYSAALSAGSGGEKRVHGGDEEGESVGSVKEEEEEIEELNEADADADADFSQLEDHHQHTAANAHDNQAHLPGPSRVEVGFKFSSASATDGGSPVRSGFRGSSNSTRLLDESSSFEADSPSPPAKTQQARAYAGDFKSSGLSVDGDDNFAEKSAEVEKPQDSNTAVAGVRHQQHQQTTMADDVDDSFAEESVQEEEGVVEEVDESFASAEKSPVQQGGESTRKEEHKYDSEGEGDDDGPEYDSDAADSHHSEKVDYKQEQKQSSPPSPPSKQAAAVAALTAEDKSHFSPTFSSANEKEGPAAAALQRATAGDFDRLDRIDIHPDMAARRANARNRVAVQRAGGSASAEGKDTVDESAGAKASVFRLGQSSISRSTLGWGANSNTMDTSASFEEDDGRSDDGMGFASSTGPIAGRGRSQHAETASSSTVATGARARYSATSQMEAVSFESTNDDQDKEEEGVRLSGKGVQRRSNNQEDSDSDGAEAEDGLGRRGGSGGSADASADDDFEADADDDDVGDFEVDDDDDHQDEHSTSIEHSPPLKKVDREEAAIADRVRAPVAAFSSPQKQECERVVDEDGDAQEAEEEEEEDDYADEDFDEDFEDEGGGERGRERLRESPVKVSAGPGTGSGSARLFAPSGTTSSGGVSKNLDQFEDDEEEEVESVEEEIEEEEEEFSVGDPGSDEEESDGGFGGKKPIAASGQKGQEQQEGSGLSRAGRSGALPGVHAPPSTTAAAAVRGSHFDALLNNSDDSNENSSNPPRARTSVGGKEGGFEGKKKQAAVPGITARMQELDSQIEEMERDDPAGHLAQLRKAHEEQQRQNSDGGGDDDDNSVASEDIDAMEFSTGGGAGDDSESSGEGSFSFLDSSSKK